MNTIAGQLVERCTVCGDPLQRHNFEGLERIPCRCMGPQQCGRPSSAPPASAGSDREVIVMQVIRTTLTRRGTGNPISPIRVITQYWSMQGDLLAEVDPFASAGGTDAQ